jgi:hypothetical protein
MSPKTETKSNKSTLATGKASTIWSDEEKAAMKQVAKERKAEARWNKNKAEGESAALEAIAAMKEPDRTMAKRLHAIIKSNAPDLLPKTWYGMPAYANKEGKIVCFFQAASKFKTRYATFGFTDTANIDEGNMFPNYYALKELGTAEEAKLGALVKKAVS